MQFRFSLKVTLIGALLMLGMLRASYWQWQRHQAKKIYIASLQKRLQAPISDFSQLINTQPQWDELPYRRVRLQGEFDFAHEMLLRNRKYKQSPGVFVLTPMKIAGTDTHVLISRGFIPLSYAEKEKRIIFQKQLSAPFIGLVKESSTRRFLAPADPPSGAGNPWVDAWLRVDIENIAKQLPYPLLPIYVEIMSTDDSKLAEAQIVSEKSDRDEMFFMAGKSTAPQNIETQDLSLYPIPVFDTVVGPGRHLGYVFEWAIMAVMTFLICMVLQFRRPRAA